MVYWCVAVRAWAPPCMHAVRKSEQLTCHHGPGPRFGTNDRILARCGSFRCELGPETNLHTKCLEVGSLYQPTVPIDANSNAI